MPSIFLFYLIFFFSQLVCASDFVYPEILGNTLIGNSPEKSQYTEAKAADTLLDIARKYDIGQNEILLANQGVDRWLPGENTKVRIPHSHLLPNTPHQGLVLNLPEFRLYFYPKKNQNQPRQVMTHPMSIGRVDWDTPLGKTRIIAKNKNPVWRPPQSIKDEHAAEGDILPDVFPAGPDNPLGQFALRLAVPGYLIHGTNKPYGVGMRVSHGCIRMYPEDIKRLFSKIAINTPVFIVNQAIKVGWHNNRLYIEIHPDLEGDELSYEARLKNALDLIKQANNNQLPVVKGHVLRQALQQRNGLPVMIFERNF